MVVPAPDHSFHRFESCLHKCVRMFDAIQKIPWHCIEAYLASHLIRNSRTYRNSNLNASFLSFGSGGGGCEKEYCFVISDF